MPTGQEGSNTYRVQCNSSTIQCAISDTICSSIQFNTIQYNTIQYNTIQYNTIQSMIKIKYLIHLFAVTQYLLSEVKRMRENTMQNKDLIIA